MPLPDGATIRLATREDVPIILALIHELAAYSHETSSVEATEQTLLSSLSFGPSNLVSPSNTTPSTGDAISSQRPARALLAFSSSGQATGLALYFYTYSTWKGKVGIHLEDLYVRESERGKGYGRELIRRVAKEVVEMDGCRLEWSVLKWNEPSIQFYRGLGAKPMEEWQVMRLDGDVLVDLAG